MPSALIVDEIASDRRELARALEAEGFHVVECESPAAAVREIWEGSFIIVFIPAVLTQANPNELSKQLHQMAPEIETYIHTKQDDRATLVRKAVEIRDGVAAA